MTEREKILERIECAERILNDEAAKRNDLRAIDLRAYAQALNDAALRDLEAKEVEDGE